jgi:hypothetical protein
MRTRTLLLPTLGLAAVALAASPARAQFGPSLSVSGGGVSLSTGPALGPVVYSSYVGWRAPRAALVANGYWGAAARRSYRSTVYFRSRGYGYVSDYRAGRFYFRP